MKKSFLLLIATATSIFANEAKDIIISENYIPQEHCEIIKTIKIKDNKNLTKEQLYTILRQKAYNLKANVVLNTTYNNLRFKKYISGNAAICDIEKSPSLKASVESFESNNSKFSKNNYTYPLTNKIISNIGIDIGVTSDFHGTVYAGLSYSAKEDYELYSHFVYLQNNHPRKRAIGYTLGIRKYLFSNTKYENIRGTINYGIQKFNYTKANGINIGLGYVANKKSGFSVDLYYKAFNSSIKRLKINDYLQLNIGYKF